MSVYNDFKNYRDKFGLNQITEKNGLGDITQNGALFTFEYLIVLLEDENTPKFVKEEELNRLRRVFASLEYLPGLSRRTPESEEGDSMDNVGANAAFSALFDAREFAKRTKSHGEGVICTGSMTIHDEEKNRKNYLIARIITASQVIFRPLLWFSWVKSNFRPKYFWNNRKPTEFVTTGWFGRSPGFMGKMDLCAQGYTTPFRWLSLLVGQFLGAFNKVEDQDARKLPYITWYFLTHGTGIGQRWFWRLAYRVWVKILMSKYTNGIRDVYETYYQDPNHPIKKWSKPYFEV